MKNFVGRKNFYKRGLPNPFYIHFITFQLGNVQIS